MTKMQEVHTIEEFFFGPDGDSEHWGTGFIERMLAEAQEKGHDQVRVEGRVIPSGTTSSRRVFSTATSTKTSPSTLVDKLREKFEEDPGEGFSGKIRIRVWDTENSGLASFQRGMRAPSSPNLTGVATLPSAGGPAIMMHEAVRPWMELTFRALDRASDLVRNSAELVKAQHPPAANKGGDGTVQTLLNGMMGMGQAAMSDGDSAPQPGGRPAPAPAGPAATPMFDHPVSGASLPWERPAPALPSVPTQPTYSTAPSGALVDHGQTHRFNGGEPMAASGPSPTVGPTPNTFTNADAERWARQNPDAARALALKIYQEGAR